MVKETERRLGPVDLLVNDAAIVAPFGPSWEVDAEHWWRLLEINPTAHSSAHMRCYPE